MQLPGAEVDPDGTVLEDLVEASGKLRMLDRLLVKLKEAGRPSCGLCVRLKH